VSVQSRKNEGASRRADPLLQAFVDALREVLDLDPIYARPGGYKRQERVDMERFYVPSYDFPRSSV
jgi:hypothetical protein